MAQQRTYWSPEPPDTSAGGSSLGCSGQGIPVRVLVRNRSRALSRPWADQVEIAVGDALDYQTLLEALDGVDTAYYLIHSMSSGSDFHDTGHPGRPHTSVRQPVKRKSTASSTWAAWESRTLTSHATCAPGTRPGTLSGRPVFRSPSSGRR